MRRLVLLLALLLGACDSGTATDTGGTPNDGVCREKDAMLATQAAAEDPAGPEGSRVSDDELAAIQEAIAKVPSDC
jgi:hypothetical protein